MIATSDTLFQSHLLLLLRSLHPRKTRARAERNRDRKLEKQRGGRSKPGWSSTHTISSSVPCRYEKQ
jgi:hypothetical protein